jgi:phenylacetaldehyde dehydrogenase
MAIDTVTVTTADCIFVRNPDNKDGDMNTQTATFPPGRLYVGGAWHDGGTGARRDVVDPADGQVLTTVVEADATDVDAAPRPARAAF